MTDHTTITVLRAAWVLDVLAFLVLNWAALALLRYLDAHPSAVGSAADGLPAPGSRTWMWRTAGGSRLLRFAWSAAAVGAEDRTVRRWASVMRVATIVIVAALLAMLLATLRHPSRQWDLLRGGAAQTSAAYDPDMPGKPRPSLLSRIRC